MLKLAADQLKLDKLAEAKNTYHKVLEAEPKNSKAKKGLKNVASAEENLAAAAQDQKAKEHKAAAQKATSANRQSI